MPFPSADWSWQDSRCIFSQRCCQGLNFHFSYASFVMNCFLLLQLLCLLLPSLNYVLLSRFIALILRLITPSHGRSKDNLLALEGMFFLITCSSTFLAYRLFHVSIASSSIAVLLWLEMASSWLMPIVSNMIHRFTFLLGLHFLIILFSFCSLWSHISWSG